jgi:hypothetical protein
VEHPLILLEKYMRDEYGVAIGNPGSSDRAAVSESASYDEILENGSSFDVHERRQFRGEATLGHAAVLLVQRGEKDIARLLLDVVKIDVEPDPDPWNSSDPWSSSASDALWLEVVPEHRDQFTKQVMSRVSEACIEISNRRGYGISQVGVREVLPYVGPQWREQLRQEFNGKRPTNQARRVRSSLPRHEEDWLAFTNPGELTVYRALKQIQEKDLPRDYTIGIYPLAGGRVPGRTWEPDVLISYRGRAGILEIDGPSHNVRRAMDLSRDHILYDTGIAFIDRVPVEALDDPAELTATLRRFLRRLGETR